MGWLQVLPAWKPTLSLQAVRTDAMLLPRSGMTSLQGRAKGVMECWYTSAERQPGEREKIVSTGPVLPDEELFAPAGLIQ